MNSTFKLRLIGMGASGMIFILSDDVVVQIVRRRYNEAKEASRMNKVLLGFLSTPSNRVIGPGRYGLGDIYRLMGQLCSGAAFLARAGLAHGDLRPDNLLIDRNRNLRVMGLGSAFLVGARLAVGTQPFARLLNEADGRGRRSYGWTGASTENFAIGSIFYSLTRSFYPYAHEAFDIPTLMKKFKAKDFPELGTSTNDKIIRNSWHAQYESVSDLEQEFRDLVEWTEWYKLELGADKWLEQLRVECESWVNAGAVGRLSIPSGE